jgi:hypothetical protein
VKNRFWLIRVLWKVAIWNYKLASDNTSCIPKKEGLVNVHCGSHKNFKRTLQIKGRIQLESTCVWRDIANRRTRFHCKCGCIPGMHTPAPLGRKQTVIHWTSETVYWIVTTGSPQGYPLPPPSNLTREGLQEVKWNRGRHGYRGQWLWLLQGREQRRPIMINVIRDHVGGTNVARHL